MNKLLEVKNLYVSYNTYAGEVQAVRGIDFFVEHGQTIAIVGESGCGKSVTAKSLMGLIEEPTGEIKKGSSILYNGYNILDYDKKQWKNYRGNECSMIFQDALTSLNPTMTVGRQIAEKLIEHKSMDKASAIKNAVELLEMVGIPDAEKRAKCYPHEFSGGMRQRVMIAIALACHPKIIIADEPTTALDVTIQAQIMDILKRLRDTHNTSIILITHDLGVVADVAQKVVVMYSGRIVEQGSVRDIFYSAKHPYTKSLLSSVPRLDLDKKQRLVSIDGMPPNLINPPVGCAFSTRCRYCLNICTKKMPPTYSFENDHTASCWLYNENASAIRQNFLQEAL